MSLRKEDMLKKLGEKILSPFKDGNAESGCCDNNTYNYGETVEVKISCLSHEPKLEKPTEFLSSDFAGIIRSHCNGVEIKHHSSYEKDIFQAEISRMHLDVIKKLAERTDLEYAIEKINITVSAIGSSSERKYSADAQLTLPSTSIEAKWEKPVGLKGSDGKIVEIHGDTDGLGDLCQTFFEENGGHQPYGIDSINTSSTPQTITFHSAETASSFVQNGPSTICGKNVYFKVRENDPCEAIVDLASDRKSTYGRSFALLGPPGNVDKSSPEPSSDSKEQYSDDLEINDLGISQTVTTVSNTENANSNINSGLHNTVGKDIHAESLAQWENKTEESDHSAISLVHENIVEIYGDIKDLSEDGLTRYLKRKEWYRDGCIQSIEMKANPPRITFEDTKAAKRVVENGLHTYLGKSFSFKFPIHKEKEGNDDGSSSISNMQPANVVEIVGDIRSLGKETLKFYLEKTERSGGGKIEEIILDTTPPRVIFCNAEAAKRVVENVLHTYLGKSFSFKFPVHKEKEGNDDGSSSISNMQPANVVEIVGDIRSLGKETLKYYLENEKRSGGGEILHLNLSVDQPQVTFRDSEAAKRVVEKSLHDFDGSKFRFKFPVQQKERKEISDQSLNKSIITRANIVEIHGDIAGLETESLETYLEDTKVSGGGKLEEVHFDATPPQVAFRDPEAAVRASSKESHKLGDISFQLKLPNTTVLREDTVMLCNVHPKTSGKSLKGYLSKLCGSAPQRVEVNHDNSVVMATFQSKIDWSQATKVHSKNRKLEGVKITIEQVPVCNRVFISKIPDSVSSDHLRLAIEKQCGSDSVEDLDYKKGREYAFITFHNPKALLRLINQEVIIEGTAVDIKEYYPSFITEHIWKITHKEPAEICIDVDGLIVDHMMNKHKRDVCQRLKAEIYAKETKSIGGQLISQACFSRCPDVPNQTDIFQSFYNKFIRKEIVADFNNKGVRDLADSLGITIHPNHGGALAAVGRKHEVERFLERVDKASHIKTHIELPSEKIQLLSSAGCLKDLEKELSVTIKEDEGKLAITGSESHIGRAESKLNLKLHNIKTSSLQITDAMWEFLKNQMTSNTMSKFMEDQKIVITLAKKKKAVKITAMSEKDLGNGMDEFQKILGEVEVTLGDNEMLFINTQRGSQALNTLASSPELFLMDRSYQLIKFTGLLSKCHAAKQELAQLFKENAFEEIVIPSSKGRTKAILSIFKDRIDKLVMKNTDSQVSVKASKDECSIQVKGVGKSVKSIAGEINNISKSICKEELVFRNPGSSIVVALDKFQHMIDGLEKDKRVVIFRREEDTGESMPTEDIEDEFDVINDYKPSRLICRYQTDNGLQLAVFQGDITKHKADAIINPANTRLSLGGGVAGAIRSAGGSVIQDECYTFVRAHGSVMDGDVVTTSAGRLPCKKVIHAVGPIWPSNAHHLSRREERDYQESSKFYLDKVMKNVLKEAEKKNCRVIAVPAISSGIFGFPKDLCAKILVSATIDKSSRKTFRSLKEVHFVNIDDPTVQVFNDEFMNSFGTLPGFQNMKNKNTWRNRSVSVNEEPQISPVYFNVYFCSSDKKVIKDVQDRITKLLEDNLTSFELRKEMYKTFPSYHLEEIQLFAKKHDVLVALDKQAGVLKVIGYHPSAVEVSNFCHAKAEETIIMDHTRERHQREASYVRSKEKQKDTLTYDHGLPVEHQIKNREIAIGANLQFEDLQETVMPEDSSSVDCVPLERNSLEFNTISDNFCKTSQAYICSRNIANIFRIENPKLLKSYLAEKTSMQIAAGKDGKSINELELFRGVHPNSVSEINKNGFSAAIADVNWPSYDSGIFYTDSFSALKHATSGKSKYRCMYLVKVLAIEEKHGSSTYKLAPKGYDSYNDDTRSSRVHGNQCYPEYLIYFT